MVVVGDKAIVYCSAVEGAYGSQKHFTVSNRTHPAAVTGVGRLGTEQCNVLFTAWACLRAVR